ncbi:hypothetical protein [Sedimentitalea todarodis]|uniref:GGDEF domain-containing protein n=1 Tax=Sedimentitalea todarodis TaxID=1631240 RepID=A0ABU3VEA0_9RHOB|nr:hypothetical protein [Sedimentitalea todarodis]MDU9004481.1 hypothetical protein [Sedimentitalea todarodis]
MPRNWVFFEGVNYEETVYNSDELPAIRGASYALLMAPEVFATRLKTIRQLEFSSSLLCEVEATEEDIKEVFFDFCANPDTNDEDLDETLKSLCFSYGIVGCSGDEEKFAAEYVAVRNASQRNRFRLNGARRPSEKKRKSLGSVNNRGKYYKTLGINFSGSSPEFPQNFKNILETKPDWVPEKFRHKMAVLEFDADRLGGKLPLDNFEIFSAASERQHVHMQVLLQELFDLLNTGERLELETLLYAGDEGILIFPVWRLQDVMNVVADHLTGKDAMSSYSVGLVICGVKAPILGIRRLTQKLLNNCKKFHENDYSDTYNGISFLQYLVTGGMDVPGGSIENYRTRILEVVSFDQPVVFSLQLSKLNAAFDLIREKKTRRAGEAAISRSRIKEAINVFRKLGVLTKSWSDWSDFTDWVKKNNHEGNSLDGVVAVALELAGTETDPSPLVPTTASGLSPIILAPLLHSEALMAFLPDAAVGVSEGPDATVGRVDV